MDQPKMSVSDELSIPMDQEEEDNDEFYSARENLVKKGSQESLKSSTPKQSATSPIVADSPRPQFFSDEVAQQGNEHIVVAKKNDKMRKMIEQRSRWDMIEYKKEDLERPAKQKASKKKKRSKGSKKKVEEEKKTKEKEEKSKTDEEDEDDKEEEAAAVAKAQARPCFKSEELIVKCSPDNPIAPKCNFTVLRFAKTQQVVEYDIGGFQPLLNHYDERAISNPWRRWGSHRALCDYGGYMVGKNKKLVEIKRGSNPPPCPPNPRQVTLNKNGELPDSQTMMGVIKIEPGPSEDEVLRIGKVMEEYVKNGGFVPRPMTKQEAAVAAAKPRLKKTPRQNSSKKKSAPAPAAAAAAATPPTTSTVSTPSTESLEGGTVEEDSMAERIKGFVRDSCSKKGIFIKRKKVKDVVSTSPAKGSSAKGARRLTNKQ